MNLSGKFSAIRSRTALLVGVVLAAVIAIAAVAAVPIAPALHAVHLAFAPSTPRGLSVPSLLVAGMIINETTLTGIRTAFKTIFNNAFSQATTMWEKVAMKVPSGTGTETYAWLGMSTRFREWLGDRVIQNLKTHGFSIRNKRFENTVSVPADAIRDDQYGVYEPMEKQLGYDAKVHPDELLFDLIKNGATEKCYDGQPFFDTDHPVLDENGDVQSVSNYKAGAKPLWVIIDNTKPIKPFIVQMREEYSFQALFDPRDPNVFFRNEFVFGATGRLNVGLGLWQLAFGCTDTLNAANYEIARIALRSVTGDMGKKLNVTPSLLIVGPTNEGAANALLKAQKDAAGADNIWYGTAEVIVVPWLE